MTTARRGRFISFEGGEGVGKSTQIGAVSARLREHGIDVVVTREPGGSPGGEAIRDLLLHSPDDSWLPESEALLFAAARSDHVARCVRPALEAGSWVLCDRFIDSTRAYQGGGSGLADADIMALHRIGSGGLLPDRTLLLNLTSEEAQARRLARQLDRPDRFEDRQAAFHARVHARFIELAASEPERIRIVDAAGPVDAVTGRLMALLSDLLS